MKNEAAQLDQVLMTAAVLDGLRDLCRSAHARQLRTLLRPPAQKRSGGGKQHEY